MNILRLFKKELEFHKLQAGILTLVVFLILSYLRGKISSPGGFLALSSISFVVLFVAIFITTYTTTKREFDQGTIYFLLQMPVTLEEILVSKILAVMFEGAIIALLGSLISYGYFISYEKIPAIPGDLVAKVILVIVAISFPVVTMFYFSFAVRIVARRFSGLITFASVITVLYIDKFLMTILAPFGDTPILIARYFYHHIYINVQVSLQDFLFYLLSGLLSVIAGILVIKKFNTL